MENNLIIIHGGGPTAVINASLVGAIREARACGEVGRIYVAIGGTGGLLKDHLRDVTDLPEDALESLTRSPASAIGTSRDAMEAPEYEAMVPILEKYGIRYVLMNGGNGTMDTCGKLQQRCAGTDIRVIGIPKTIDNDLAVTDHAPGYGSAARYMAGSVAEVCCDVESLPIHVCVIEALGRNAGWITAASALATDSYAHGPDLIYLPERVFAGTGFQRGSLPPGCQKTDRGKAPRRGGGQRGLARPGRETRRGSHLYGRPGNLFRRRVRPSGAADHQRIGL